MSESKVIISSNEQNNENNEASNRPVRKLRSALRRALSDRVFKIIDFSQQYINLEKVKKSCSNHSVKPSETNETEISIRTG